jgi:hypothetical protein
MGNPSLCIYRVEQGKCFLMFAFPFEVNVKEVREGITV